MESKLQSFSSFAETRKKIIEDRTREEQSTKRQTESQRFAELLAEYGVTSVNELDEEKRVEFFSSLVGETEDLETEGNKFGAAVKKAKEDGEDEFEVDGKKYQVEGNKFGAAVKKAKEDGEDEFEVDGKKFKVEAVTAESFGAEVNEKAQLMDEETGKIVKLPYKTKDFRGDAITVTGFTEPHKSSSSGRIQTDQGEYFPGVAGCKIVGHKYESTFIDSNENTEINEGIQVEGKRTAKKVVTQLNRIFTKQLPDLQQMGKTGIYGCVKYFLDYAMTDANFHTERAAVVKTIKKANIGGIEVKLPGLGGYHAKISGGRIKEILHQYAGQISNAAGFSGQGIVEGCALYLSQMQGDDATATAMINAFNSQFEGEAVRVDVTKKTKALNEGRRFVAAVNKAREAGEETFEFDGKTYKVTSKVNEAEVKSDDDFMEMTKAIYKKAFGDKFDETKAEEAAKGMLKKADGDYGAAVGMLQSSVG
jgi:hypothetical protein